MDMPGNDTNVEQEKRNEDPIDYHAPNVSAGWQINENNLTNTSVGMIQLGNSMLESSACSTAFMADSFCPPIWDQPINGQSLGFCDVGIQNDSSTSSSLGPGRAGMGWSPNTMLRGGMFLPTVPGMLPPSLPHFPADSAFIERAARFSCFSGGNFSEMMNPISFPDHLNPYSQGLGSMQGTHEVFGGNGSKSLSRVQSQRHEMNVAEVSKEALLPSEHGTEGSPLKNEKKVDTFRCSHDEAKHGVDVSGNESDEAEFSGRGVQEELDGATEDSTGNVFGFRKRKRTGQDTEHNDNDGGPVPSIETAKDHTEIKRKGDPNPTSVSKPGGRHGKQGSQGSDIPKEEYIHVRARRGQATNSHSLAERVRREKISERMKFLQDLVPGCSKVTGKAVMLDEIINYVQSLQRQVEFLSMKLATVNPRLEFNIEGFLAKDILQPRTGMSSSLAFPPDMTIPFPPLHPSQPGLIQAPVPGLGNATETLRRPMSLQSTALCGGFKALTSQIPGVWDDELHNVVHMGFSTSAPLNSQDLSGSIPPGHLKAEP